MVRAGALPPCLDLHRGRPMGVFVLTSLLTLASLTAPNPGQAQTIPAGAGAQISLERFTFDEPADAGIEEISLLTFPFQAELGLAPWLQLAVSGAWASAEVVRSDGSSHTLEGPTDTAIRLALPLVRDRFLVAAVVLLPTGQSTFSREDAELAGVVAADLLPLRISNWGTGGGLDLSSSVAIPMGGANLGARVGYHLGREFDLLEGQTFQYRPGDQLYGRLALDGNLGDGRAAAQLTFYRFQEDLGNDQNLYRAGDRVQGMVSYTFPAGRRSAATLHLGGLHRQQGVFLDGSPDVPSQTIALGGLEARRPFRYGVLRPSVDVRALRNDEGLDQGWLGGIGLQGELRAPGGSVTFLPLLRARFGRIQPREDLTSGVLGLELGAGLRFGGGSL